MRAQRSPLVIALAAGCYLAVGLLSRELTSPPNYATAVWPPAGIALGLLVAFGTWAWPAVLLGAGALNTISVLVNPATTEVPAPLLLGILIAAGLTAQAVTGALLIRRILGAACPLIHQRDIVAFALFGGPVSCSIGATWGVGSLYLGGAILESDVVFNWWTWWVGDSIGSLTVAPIVLILFGQPRSLWRPRLATVGLPLLTTLAAAVGLYFFARDFERVDAESSLRQYARVSASALELECDRIVNVVAASETILSAHGDLDEREFKSFARGVCLKNPALRALAWVPLVSAAERGRFEAAVQASGVPRFEISEFRADGVIQRAGSRRAYSPIEYVEALAGGAKPLPLGLDLGAAPEYAEALERATLTEAPAASRAVRLRLDADADAWAFLLAAPRFGLVPEREERELKGFVIGAVEVSKLMTSAVARLGDLGIDLCLLDAADSKGAQLIFCSPPEADRRTSAPPYSQHYAVDLGGRDLLAMFRPYWPFLRAQRAWLAWTVLFSGAAFTALLGGLLLIVTGRTVQIERSVEERTAALNAANRDLEREIGGRERAQEALAEARDRALDAARSKAAFLATMSHEVRTPMNAVIGMTEVLLRSTLDADQRDCVETVRRSGESLLAILNDVLDFSKSDAGRLELESVAFDLPTVVADSIDLFAEAAEQRGIELVEDVAPDLPAEFVGDPGRLRQVLVNLVGNAVKFTERGEVVLRVENATAEDGRSALAFEVRDTGIGIDPAVVDRLFEPFCQADSSTTRRYGGTGLGLAICRQLVELMGGSIRVESTPGCGSAFRFVVPFRRGAETPAVSRDPLAGRSALIAAANASLAAALARPLAAAGMSTTAAATAEEARTLIGAAAFDVFLIDARLGEQLGSAELERLARSAAVVSLCPRLRPLPPGTPAGVLRLAKPVHPRNLLQQVRRALGHEQRESRGEPARAPVPALLVLVADDHPVNLKIAARMLAQLGCSVETVSNGRAALAALERRRFDLVLMDCQMPEMDGLDATRLIRAREGEGAHTTIVAMTANTMPADLEACIHAGMDAHLPKPFSLDALERLVRSAAAARGVTPAA